MWCIHHYGSTEVNMHLDFLGPLMILPLRNWNNGSRGSEEHGPKDYKESKCGVLDFDDRNQHETRHDNRCDTGQTHRKPAFLKVRVRTSLRHCRKKKKNQISDYCLSSLLVSVSLFLFFS